jgi:hypothetical protein
MKCSPFNTSDNLVILIPRIFVTVIKWKWELCTVNLPTRTYEASKKNKRKCKTSRNNLKFINLMKRGIIWCWVIVMEKKVWEEFYIHVTVHRNKFIYNKNK